MHRSERRNLTSQASCARNRALQDEECHKYIDGECETCARQRSISIDTKKKKAGGGRSTKDNTYSSVVKLRQEIRRGTG